MSAQSIFSVFAFIKYSIKYIFRNFQSDSTEIHRTFRAIPNKIYLLNIIIYIAVIAGHSYI